MSIHECSPSAHRYDFKLDAPRTWNSITVFLNIWQNDSFHLCFYIYSILYIYISCLSYHSCKPSLSPHFKTELNLEPPPFRVQANLNLRSSCLSVFGAGIVSLHHPPSLCSTTELHPQLSSMESLDLINTIAFLLMLETIQMSAPSQHYFLHLQAW